MNLRNLLARIYEFTNESNNRVKIGNYNGGLNFIFHGNKIKVTSGKYSYGTVNVYSYQKIGEIKIGNYVSISDIKILIGGDHHMNLTTYPMKAIFKHYPIERDNPQAKGVIIQNDVWIGLDAMILDGVTIGNGAVIGARTVIAKDVPDYAVVVGNPSRIIKYRFSKEEIGILLELKWWELDKSEIDDIIYMFYDNNIEKFVGTIKEKRGPYRASHTFGPNEK